MLLSQTAQYALRAVYYLVTDDENKWHLTKDVAEVTKIPAPYLARIMSTLAKRGILQSRTGMGGGFKISKEGMRHNLYDVVSQFDNLENISDCIFGFMTCCEGNHCILHDSWYNLKNQLIDMLKSKTLQDIKYSAIKVDWSRVEA